MKSRAWMVLLVAVLAVAVAYCGKEGPSAFQQEANAYVAEGWARHEATYRALLAARRTPDPAGQLHYAWAKTLPDTLRDAGPLVFEILVERADDPEARVDALAVLPRVARTAGPRLQELLLAGARTDSGLDRETRRLLAYALASIPRSRVDADQALEALTEAVRAGDADLSRHLLEVVSRTAGRLETPRERDALVAAVAGVADLTRLVGDAYKFQRIALIGGPVASTLVLDHVIDAEDPRTNQWAVNVAGRLDWSQDLGEWLFSAMAPSPADTEFFTDVVTRRQAVNACRDLVARYATGDPLDRKVLGAIYARLQDVEAAGFASDERLEQAFEALTQELEAALAD